MIADLSDDFSSSDQARGPVLVYEQTRRFVTGHLADRWETEIAERLAVLYPDCEVVLTIEPPDRWWFRPRTLYGFVTQKEHR